MHVPADAPPQPLRYWPAKHDEATHAEHTDAPGLETSQQSLLIKFEKFVWKIETNAAPAMLKCKLSFTAPRKEAALA